MRILKIMHHAARQHGAIQ